MLAACVRHGWPVEGYLSLAHPLQQNINAALRQLTGLETLQYGVDGCGAPVAYLPIWAMARAFARLSEDQHGQKALAAMAAHPVLVGGPGRVDTALMQATQGRVIAKVGAEGVLCAAHPGKQQGTALKMLDGNGDVRDVVFVHLLRQLGWLDDAAWQDAGLYRWTRPVRHNTLGHPVVEIVPLL
jgi:L-asparaginase II